MLNAINSAPRAFKDLGMAIFLVSIFYFQPDHTDFLANSYLRLALFGG
jgi:hypothetical protein